MNITSLPAFSPSYSKGESHLKSTVDPEKAWKAAQDFEVSFTSHLIQQLFSENKSGLFGGGQPEVMFRSLWAEKVAESMSGTFGIAESVFPILLKDKSHDKPLP